MTNIAACRTLLTGSALAVAAVLIAGCSSQGSSSTAPASGSASARATSSASVAPSPTAPAGTGTATPAGSEAAAPSASAGQSASAAASFTRVPLEWGAGGEFFSPSGNISCEVDYHRAGVPDGAYCETLAPARSVTMSVAGTYTTCTGMQCESNAAEGTPTLAYGTETGVGPFLCQSATTGITCTADGKGFLIAASGITSVG